MRAHARIHAGREHLAGREGVAKIKRSMPRPKARYSLVVKNHASGERLKVELVELPFSETRRFRLRVNGHWAAARHEIRLREELEQLRRQLAISSGRPSR